MEYNISQKYITHAQTLKYQFITKSLIVGILIHNHMNSQQKAFLCKTLHHLLAVEPVLHLECCVKIVFHTLLCSLSASSKETHCYLHHIQTVPDPLHCLQLINDVLLFPDAQPLLMREWHEKGGVILTH